MPINFNRPTHEFADGRIITFRSNWECNFTFYLEWLKKRGEIKNWEYEPERISWIGGSYLPDFKVWRNDGTYYYAEIKGAPKGINKFKRAKKECKGITFELWNSEAYKELKKKMGRILNFI